MWGWISGAKSGSANVPVTSGEEFGASLSGRTVFKLFHGTSKTTNDEVTVFKFEASASTTPDQQSVAKAEFKRMRVLRHPNVVKYVDGVDNDTTVIIVTEPVTPLLDHVQDKTLSSQGICWGLYQIVVTLKFIHVDCNIAHRNLYTSSVFVSKSGDWKVGGVAWCDGESTLLSPSRTNQYLSKYDPPEVLRGVNTSFSAGDVWFLGVLIWEVFNGSLQSAQNLRDTSKIPQKLIQVYRKCVSANFKSRPSIDAIFNELSKPGGYFDNHFISANLFLNELSIKQSAEKQHFFSQIGNQLSEFPDEFCKYKILPGLVMTFDFGDAGINILPTLFRLGKMLSGEEYKKSIIPCVLKLFSSTDRAIRIQLLSQLDNFIEYIDNGVIDQQIFQSVATGFTDTVPGMREQTVKSMLLIAPKLSESTIDNILLKYLAKAQTDPEPPIRTNTTICISKICCHFSEGTRRKVLIPAFLRAIKDPFLHARHAGLVSLGCTAQYYHEPDIATRIIPAISSLLIDPEKIVRDQAMKAMKLFIDRIEKHYKNKSFPDSKESEDTPTGEAGGWASMLSMSRYVGQSSETPKSLPPSKDPVKSQVVPTNIRAAVKQEVVPKDDSFNDPSAGWDDEEPSHKPDLNIPKTKSSMKLSASKKDHLPDDDYVSSILEEERDLLNKQKPKFIPYQQNSKGWESESFDDMPAPWDFSTPKQNENPAPDSALASYFSSDLNTNDFFSEMGVDNSKPQVASKPESEWDNFALAKSISSKKDNDWDTIRQVTDKPRAKSPQILQKITKQSFDWGDDWGNDEFTDQSKPTKASYAQSIPPRNSLRPKLQSASTTSQKTTSNDWGFDSGNNDWGDSWDDKEKKKEQRRVAQQQKRAQRNAERGNRKGGLGGAKKANSTNYF